MKEVRTHVRCFFPHLIVYICFNFYVHRGFAQWPCSWSWWPRQGKGQRYVCCVHCFIFMNHMFVGVCSLCCHLGKLSVIGRVVWMSPYIVSSYICLKIFLRCCGWLFLWNFRHRLFRYVNTSIFSLINRCFIYRHSLKAVHNLIYHVKY